MSAEKAPWEYFYSIVTQYKLNQKLILNDLIVFSQNWNKVLNNYWNLEEFTKLAINTEKNINNIETALSGRVIKSLRILNKLNFWFSELE